MDEFANYRLCTNGAGQYVNNLMTSNGHVPSLEKKVSDKDTNSSRQSNTRNRFIIKNYLFDERELTEDELTKHRFKGLLRDGLGLANVDIKSVHRKKKQGVYTGIVVVETSNMENKKEVMKNKSKLKSIRQFEKVYIENDMPLETRNFQNAMRTVLKEMGKDKDYKFAGSRLLAKRT
ncbi:Hypothetical predicted protein [Mytilus galloprovincialis]|uniref:Uncharacterized protein n=1 Tax=Mytilus galloprovincialis TaxID=29158 RepID=A0A8B6FGQ9_MYTGA|nr:Hypothetical predicted protein [Mytilus galloprovincialis]